MTPLLPRVAPHMHRSWTDAELESRVRLDGVVTVVDAVNVNRQLNEPRPRGAVNEAQLQVGRLGG